MLVSRLCCSVRKGGTSGIEAVSRVEKSTTKQHANCADLSSITKVTRFLTLAYAAGNNSKLAPLGLWIPNLADRDRDHLLLFIC